VFDSLTRNRSNVPFRPGLEALEDRLVPAATNVDFVQGGYLTALHRQPDPGAAGFVSALDSGTVSRTQIASAIINSDEGQLTLIRDAYRTVLLREADSAGEAGFLGFLRSGGNIEQVEAFMAASPEFAIIYASDPTPDATTQYVDGLYSVFFGRSADASALATFVPLLNSGGISRFNLALALENSNEGDTAQVQELYGNVLNRPADPGGLAGGIGFLQGGGAFTDLEAALLGSDEFFIRGATG